MANLYIPVCAFFISLLTLILFFGKKRVSNKETKIFSGLVVTSFIDCVVMVCIITIAYMVPTHFSLYILNKIDFVQYLTWAWLFFMYIFYVSTSHHSEKKYSTIFKFTSILNIILLIIICILPLYLHSENDVMYSYGPSVSLLYAACGSYLFLAFLITLFNIRKIHNKKYFPIIVLLFLGGLALAIRAVNPGLLVIPFVMAYIDLIMYFTIENPDLQMIQELELARQQAEKANNAKTEFLSSMSHEIRTPLNAIVGFSQALSEEDISDSAKEEVKDIMMASENLLEIVNGILDISKIEANKLEIVNTEYSLPKILNELVSLTKARLGEKPIDFRVDFDSDLPDFLYGDYMRIKQIVLNLLTNAVKYTKSGHIGFHVSCIKKDDVCRLIISVEDTGIGIQPEKIDKLFTKFERFDLENNITIEGTGLGLAITKKLIDLMGGKIVVQSVYGKGSKFTVALDQRIVLEPALMVEDSNKMTPLESYPNLSKFRVLVVDDNKVNLKVAARLLKDYKLNITEVSSGYECVEKIRAGERYHLILLDDMMPKMSGVETLQFLKIDKSFDIPIVALTANAISGMREKYLKDGFNDYLSKPIDREELNRVIEKFLIQK